MKENERIKLMEGLATVLNSPKMGKDSKAYFIPKKNLTIALVVTKRAKGLTYKQIAEDLGITERRVKYIILGY